MTRPVQAPACTRGQVANRAHILFRPRQRVCIGFGEQNTCPYGWLWSRRIMQRRLAAIVCADVAGYSRMMGADEAGTHAAFKAHRSAIYPLILNHGGRMVKHTGDGFMLEFPSVVGALEATIQMQQLMAERNAQLPADRVMRFRMGVHMGDVIADEDEVFGDDVNIAVRLESVAAPGGAAVSAKAYLEAGKRLSMVLVNAGSHQFKNIDELVNVWTWEPSGTDASAFESKTASHLPAQYRTAIVGVLPFVNLSDSADEYFADGLTEDLIHALSLQSFYRVLSRNATFAFKRHAPSPCPAERARARRAALDRSLRPRCRRPVRHDGRLPEHPAARHLHRHRAR